MFSHLFRKNIQKVGFEDIQYMYKNPEKYILINTLPNNQQECLIYNTIPYEKEEILLNTLLQSYDLHNKHIVIYGKNSIDETSEKKTETKWKKYGNIVVVPEGYRTAGPAPDLAHIKQIL